jgi:iron complex outermembrane recepter protein
MFAKSYGHAGRFALAVSLVLPPAFAQSEFQSNRYDLLAALDPVVVTASKYEDDPLRVPAYVTYLTRSQIENSGAITVNEAIIRLAGIAGRPSLAGGNEYSLDPMGYGDTFSSNTVIAIDGVPIKDGDSSESRLSSIPIDHVDRIEIQRGGASVLYGENAVAAVINVITRASSTDFSPQSVARIYTSLGSFNSKEISGSGYYAANGLKLSFAGFTRTSDGYRTNSGSKNTAVMIDTQMQHEKIRLGLSLHADALKADLPGSLTISQFKTNPRQQDEKYRNDNIDSNVVRLGVFFETELAGLNLKSTVVQRKKDVVFNGTIPVQTQANNLNTVNNFWDLVLRNTSQFGKNKNIILLGVELNRWQQDRDNQFGIYDYSSVSDGFYIKNNLDITEHNTQINIGLRSEKITRKIAANEFFAKAEMRKSDTQIGWEAGVSHALNARSSIYLRSARSYRLPNIDEATSRYDLPYIPLQISLINPQTSVDHELGWKYFSAESIRAGVRFYQSRLKDEIAYDDAAYANVNLDRTRRTGTDLEMVLTLNPKISVSTFVSFRLSKFASGQYQGNHVPLAPRKLAALSADWSFSSNQKIGAGFNYISGQYAASDFQNVFAIPSYTTVDIRYVYRKKSFQVGLNIRNLLNKSYYSYGSLENDFSNFPSVSQYLAVYPDPGRSITGSLRVLF